MLRLAEPLRHQTQPAARRSDHPGTPCDACVLMLRLRRSAAWACVACCLPACCSTPARPCHWKRQLRSVNIKPYRCMQCTSRLPITTRGPGVPLASSPPPVERLHAPAFPLEDGFRLMFLAGGGTTVKASCCKASGRQWQGANIPPARQRRRQRRRRQPVALPRPPPSPSSHMSDSTAPTTPAPARTAAAA